MVGFDRQMVELQMLIATMGRQLIIIAELIERLRRRQQRAEPQKLRQHKECSPKLKDNSRPTTQG